MKKLVSLFLAVVLAATLSTVCFAQASETLVSQTTQQLADGSVVTINLYQSNSPLARASTISGKKDYVYSSGGSTAWVFSVYGTFSVNNGVSATCTKSTYSFTSYQPGWSVTAASVNHFRNTAYASATVVKGHTIYPSVSISCDANGNLS